MAANGLTPIRVVIGCDNAGHAYKEALKETMKKHSGVSEVIDVGVNDPKDGNAYPNIAVDAARKIKNGEVGIHLFPTTLSCMAHTDSLRRPTAHS